MPRKLTSKQEAYGMNDNWNMQDLLLTAAFMLELKESDPDRHKRISDKWYEILKDIEPGSGKAPAVYTFILDIVNGYES